MTYARQRCLQNNAKTPKYCVVDTDWKMTTSHTCYYCVFENPSFNNIELYTDKCLGTG